MPTDFLETYVRLYHMTISGAGEGGNKRPQLRMKCCVTLRFPANESEKTRFFRGTRADKIRRDDINDSTSRIPTNICESVFDPRVTRLFSDDLCSTNEKLYH